MSQHRWYHCQKHNIDYPNNAECPKCESEKRKIASGRSIKCPIGGMVNPNNLCPKCAYATGCKSYEAYLNDEDSYKPDKDSEALLIEPLQILLRLREIYWRLRSKLSEFKDWLRYIWNQLKENVDIIMAFAPIAFFVAIAILILSGVLKVHIEF